MPTQTPKPPVRRVRWPQAHRILPSRYPPIQLFERLSADPAEWETLAEIESLTNPRIRDELGEIRLVPAAERVSGPGASWVMASFTHLNPNGSRFSDGSYGVYYAARELPTAIAETVFHLGRFYAATADPPHAEAMRVLVGRIDAGLHDLRGGAPAWAPFLDPDDYSASRALGRRLRERGSNGIVYPSVRRAGGQCVGALRPKAVGLPIQGRHLQYFWDGGRISRYFDYALDRWVALPWGAPALPPARLVQPREARFEIGDQVVGVLQTGVDA